MPQYLTIDIGGTTIKFAVMDENAQISEQGEIPKTQ
jgi:predicted NBD/HSP70 family sugar kinase